ncbi:MAG: family N-acetyltransferase [Frankiales bacterium]|nr:family N-acetyltransferase [Frankiales bacterium]
MTFTIRSANLSDMPAIALLDSASFGITYTEQDIEDALLVLEPERFLLVVDDTDAAGSAVAVAGDYPFDLTVPGGKQLAVPGVTWVSVSPTHRRRGLLRSLMEHQLRKYVADEQPLAVLTASEGGIYGRFGYGAATQIRRTVIDRRFAQLRHRPAEIQVRLVEPAEARPLVAEIHDRWRRTVPGAINRTAARWDRSFLDRPGERGGMSARLHLVHPDGYVIFRIREDWVDGRAQNGCTITDYVALTRDAHAQLWQVMLGMDLVGPIESNELPLDDPLPQLLADPRQLRTVALRDGMWVRLLDVPTALAARRYEVEIEAVLGVHDPFLGDANYLLRGGPEGASCERTDRTPDVRLAVQALGAAYLGGPRLSFAAEGGQLEYSDQRLLRRLDLAFLADRVPFHGTGF